MRKKQASSWVFLTRSCYLISTHAADPRQGKPYLWKTLAIVGIRHEELLNGAGEVRTRFRLNLLFHPRRQCLFLKNGLLRQRDLFELAVLVLVCPSVRQDDRPERRHTRIRGEEHVDGLGLSDEDALSIRAAENSLLPWIPREDICNRVKKRCLRDNVSASRLLHTWGFGGDWPKFYEALASTDHG